MSPAASASEAAPAFASAELQAYYAARAPSYDTVYVKPERQVDLGVLQQHISARLAGRSVLEVACGTGYWTQFIAPAASALTATDWTVQTLELARQRPNTGKVRFIEADAYALPPGLGQFRAAFAGLWFSHVPVQARAAFLQSLHARLMPGARVLLLDNSELQCRELPIVERDAEGNTYQRRRLADGSAHRVLKNFPGAAELAACVAQTACAWQHLPLENFWLFEYELSGPI